MGFIIGDNGVGISTWAVLRGAVIQNNPPSRYDNNEVYPDTGIAFKSIEGKGLLKRGFTEAFFIADLTIRIDDTDFYLQASNFDENYHSELIGQDVLNDSDELYTIDSDAFVPPGYQGLSPMPTTYTIVDIGLFEPIT
jgi:hypothetical protein